MAAHLYLDYPMTSTLSAEHRIMGSRARLIIGVFSFLGLGSLAAGIVFLVLLMAFKSAIESNINRLEWVWRLLLGLGIIPVAITLYFRLTMRETKPYQTCKCSPTIQCHLALSPNSPLDVATETSLTDKTKRGYATQIREFRE
jgi:PHS family inorganic phosphate transporter-like MFS transporter